MAEYDVDSEMDWGSWPDMDFAPEGGLAVQVLDEEDLYYVPDRRPSLDLGSQPPSGASSPHWFGGPILNYTSMVSEGAMNAEASMDNQDEGESFTRVCLENSGSFSSSYSFNSDCEKTMSKSRSKGDAVSLGPKQPTFLPDPNELPNPALSVDFTFKAISKTLQKMEEWHLVHFKGKLWKHYQKSFTASTKKMDLVDLVDRLLECYNLQGSLQLVKHLLKEMGLGHLVNYLEDLCIQNEVRFELRKSLKSKYRDILEDVGTQAEKKPFDSIFTDLHMTAEADNGPNIEHEYRNIGKLNSHHKSELISFRDIFSTSLINENCVKALLTTGMVGTGKSMAVQKFILDWAEGQSHQHISFVFPLPFRELNAFHGSQVSMLGILHQLYPDTTRLKDICTIDGHVLFVLDGLDEYHWPLNFQSTELCCDFKEAKSFDVLLVNLLRGNLFYHGLLWVTSRPLKTSSLPSELVHRMTEVRGFDDHQREEYFRKRFVDPVQAARVIARVNSCTTLRIMCHLPLFCSVLSQVLERTCMGQTGEAYGELPQSITPVYTQLLLQLLSKRQIRAPEARSLADEKDFLVNLGKMAWRMLEEGQVKISRAHWPVASGVSINEAVVNSGLCTEFTVSQVVMFNENVHCFIHSTIQEYMAALYVFLELRNQESVLFKGLPKRYKRKLDFKKNKERLGVYQDALEQTLLCGDGRFNVFLRFLFGMALKSNVELLKPFISTTEDWPSVIQDTASLIRKKISKNRQNLPNTSAILQHCLDELAAV